MLAVGVISVYYSSDCGLAKASTTVSLYCQGLLPLFQDVYNKFEDVYQGLSEVTECLYLEVQEWQYQLKLAYVELKATVDLEGFAPW